MIGQRCGLPIGKAMTPDERLAKLLMAPGFGVNDIVSIIQTPLHVAAETGHNKSAKSLIHVNALINARNVLT